MTKIESWRPFDRACKGKGDIFIAAAESEGKTGRSRGRQPTRPESIAKQARERAKHQRIVDAAKAICNVCVNQEDCLGMAITNNEIGVWGNTTTEERRSLTRASK